jgi:hypothetical protein
MIETIAAASTGMPGETNGVKARAIKAPPNATDKSILDLICGQTKANRPAAIAASKPNDLGSPIAETLTAPIKVAKFHNK